GAYHAATSPPARPRSRTDSKGGSEGPAGGGPTGPRRGWKHAASERYARSDTQSAPSGTASAPTTEPQREIWTAAHLGDDASLAFNESVTVRLRGALDVTALRAAVADLLDRHEALRATFTADGLTLLISDGAGAELAFEDLTPLTEAERDARLATRAEAAVTTPFDLERGPLVGLSLHRVAADDHRLLFTAHHIVCDGFSTGVVLRELGRLYTARRRGEQPSLPPAESFTRYAAALRGRVGCSAAADDERYWLGRFTGELPVLDLPTDRARPPRKTYASLREDSVIGGEALSDLKRTAGKLRSSLFAVLLAGFQALLARLTGQEDLVVGVPAAGQSDGEGHGTLVGHAVNLLPIRASVGAGRPFAELAAEVRGALLDAFEHQGLTFGALLARLPVARDPSRLPLVSVVFNLDRGLESDALGFEGLVASVVTNPRRYENFDLFVNAVEIGGHLELECQFNSDLLDRATVGRWLAAYAGLLASVVRDPTAVVGDLDALPPGDLERLAAWNRTSLPVPPGRTVPELIRAQVAATPDAVTLEVDGEELTYAELGRRAARLSRRLRELGAGRGALVGLLLERTPDLVVALLAVLESGAGYVPLDPGYPRERLAYMAEDAGLAVIIGDSRTLAELDLTTGTPLRLDREALALALLPEAPLPRDERSAGPDDIAYVIYTSGSTGRPKGVLVPHRGVVNLLASVAVTPGMSADDRVLALTTLSFDIAVSEVILPLTVGARIVLVSREVAADGARLLEVIRRRAVTFLDATPAT
ncbi:MAG: AMP-binding protein, partial [Deltaproteobacteria bacterium]|nr:AMP-binding protein [Deltaproteobacteria bacterium]